MPIYAYKCAECGHQLELIQKVSDALLTDCPNCSKPALVKQLTAAGFQLKGGGWYVTDFRDSGKKKDTKPDDKAKTDQSAKSDQAADSKSGKEPTAKPDTGTEKSDSKGDSGSDSKSSAAEPSSKPAPAPAPASPPAPKTDTN